MLPFTQIPVLHHPNVGTSLHGSILDGVFHHDNVPSPWPLIGVSHHPGQIPASKSLKKLPFKQPCGGLSSQDGSHGRFLFKYMNDLPHFEASQPKLFLLEKNGSSDRFSV